MFGALTPALHDALEGSAGAGPPAHVEVLPEVGVAVHHLAALAAGGHFCRVLLGRGDTSGRFFVFGLASRNLHAIRLSIYLARFFYLQFRGTFICM